jgi:hypothetical protein
LLPKEFLSLMLLFAPLFSKRIWQRILVLVVGAILAPGKRTVSAMHAGDGFALVSRISRTTTEC